MKPPGFLLTVAYGSSSSLPLDIRNPKEIPTLLCRSMGFKSQTKAHTFCCSYLYGKYSVHASIWPVNNICACADSNYINMQANRVTMPTKFELKLVIALTLEPLSIIQITKSLHIVLS